MHGSPEKEARLVKVCHIGRTSEGVPYTHGPIGREKAPSSGSQIAWAPNFVWRKGVKSVEQLCKIWGCVFEGNIPTSCARVLSPCLS